MCHMADHPDTSGSQLASADVIGGTPRATRRPAGVAAPAHWQHDAAPPPAVIPFLEREEKGRPDPVRYGDWELKGIAIDF